MPSPLEKTKPASQTLTRAPRRLVFFIALSMSTLLLGSCTNTINMGGAGPASGDSDGTDKQSTPSTRHRISSVQFNTGSGEAAGTVAVLFDAAQSTAPLSESCSATTPPGASSLKPCACQFDWSELNTTGSESVTIPRTGITAVQSVQSNLALCATPAAYSEIATGTPIRISVIPAGSSTARFSSTVFVHTKSESNSVGNFQDALGASFANIHRYTCYDTNSFPKNLSSLVYERLSDDQSRWAYEVFSTSFCAKDAGQSDEGDGATAVTGSGLCPSNPARRSNQAYFYNLFIRSSDLGQINASNQRYSCPRVLESLTGRTPDFWPLDSSFALALSRNATFNVGIEAFSKLSLAGDPNSSPSSCSEGEATDDAGGGDESEGDSSSLVRSCIGFAARPNPDGTCPYFTTPQGTIRQTYRLRRFLALYPPQYSATGKLLEGRQASDVVYVVDRPVAAPSNDPLKPYSMRGPKPCPFSYYDEKGVLGDPNDPDYPGGMPSYAATNHSGWNGTNVDGIEFPNSDRTGQSCSTTLPILNASKTRWSVSTLNERNPKYKRLFVRPGQAWSPHYLEDTDFAACAPLAEPFRDPPLHFSKDPSTGNVAWCAETYPTQNPAVQKIDKKGPSGTYPGKVASYTSHVVKNASGVACTASPLNLTSILGQYPANPAGAGGSSCKPATQTHAGAAWHPNNWLIDSAPATSGSCSNSSVLVAGSPLGTCHYCAHQTCDRTVALGPTDWDKFPLLAPPANVEAALASDTTYGCVITYDNGGGKAGKATPSEGCCGAAVRVWSGLDNTATPNANRANRAAHLEPGQPCLLPKY
jgi:hypothetical protein